MRRAFIAIVFLCLLGAAFRQTGNSLPNLVKEVAPGVFYREPEPDKRIIATSGWIVFRDYVMVVDANFPWGARAILNDLRQTTKKPIRYVFNTHYHGDHAFGNSVLVDAGAAVICSEECAAESKERNTEAWRNDKGTGGFSLKQFRLEHPQIAFRDFMAVDDGTRRVELLRVGPGHTRGDAIAWLPKERVMFTGDLAINRAGNYVGDPGADPDNWVRALDALAERDVAVVVPGHGPQGTRETIRGNRAYLADMVARVRSGIAKGATAEQLQQEIDPTSHKPWGANQAQNRASIKAFYDKLKRR